MSLWIRFFGVTRSLRISFAFRLFKSWMELNFICFFYHKQYYINKTWIQICLHVPKYLMYFCEYSLSGGHCSSLGDLGKLGCWSCPGVSGSFTSFLSRDIKSVYSITVACCDNSQWVRTERSWPKHSPIAYLVSKLWNIFLWWLSTSLMIFCSTTFIYPDQEHGYSRSLFWLYNALSYVFYTVCLNTYKGSYFNSMYIHNHNLL